MTCDNCRLKYSEFAAPKRMRTTPFCSFKALRPQENICLNYESSFRYGKNDATKQLLRGNSCNNCYFRYHSKIIGTKKEWFCKKRRKRPRLDICNEWLVAGIEAIQNMTWEMLKAEIDQTALKAIKDEYFEKINERAGK